MTLQSDLFIHLMIQYLLLYHHNRIALRRAPRITLNCRLFPVAGLAPLAVPRDAVVDYSVNVERLNARVANESYAECPRRSLLTCAYRR